VAHSTQELLAGVTALVLGSVVAWVDTRPNWDDTGVTAGALVLSAAVAVALGLRWWASALLVAFPIVLLEHRIAGWGVFLIPVCTIAGSALGSVFRGMSGTPRVN
jgi:hypothetical protein